MDEHVRPADCGGNCVPQSVVAPFNPLSQYRSLTSDYDLSHPPGWVRKDLEKRRSESRPLAPSPMPASHPPMEKLPLRRGHAHAGDGLVEKSEREDEEQDKKAEEDMKELERMEREEEGNRRKDAKMRRLVLKDVMEKNSQTKDAALMRVLARIGREQSETMKLNNASGRK
ncbi:hypothetical protein GUITHDRAFT_156660 [Guillardia theta CCMP2712]|uniref:Uncharacterized protein n=1 Tax=Guillardia theta (strain CCMP2712) TaxID=905079 RepID=L1I5K7_GUITC|nr:hypothetical protein GUITHDRAFT_156660 [Guillardia theta CCMP2712]EKX31169.1 hypothetical protein GUITHDRAFT_156660 [Guillardia theta CCMP2712]|eukprot:XP_005818149.1 hypothetical protein GUITHDRAFT_156660 [Guillardia theta CCMP2712]